MRSKLSLVGEATYHTPCATSAISHQTKATPMAIPAGSGIPASSR